MTASSAMPWKWRERPTGERVLVFASRFDGAGLRNGMRVMRSSMRIRRQLLRTPGAIGVSLYARPFRGSYYTFSAWRDEAALGKFARSAEHRDGVKALRAMGKVDGVLISWWEDGTDWQPRWSEVLRRTEASARGPYAGPDASTVARPAA